MCTCATISSDMHLSWQLLFFPKMVSEFLLKIGAETQSKHSFYQDLIMQRRLLDLFFSQRHSLEILKDNGESVKRIVRRFKRGTFRYYVHCVHSVALCPDKYWGLILVFGDSAESGFVLARIDCSFLLASVRTLACIF